MNEIRDGAANESCGGATNDIRGAMNEPEIRGGAANESRGWATNENRGAANG